MLLLLFVSDRGLGLTNDADWALTYVAKEVERSRRMKMTYINETTSKNNKEPWRPWYPVPLVKCLKMKAITEPSPLSKKNVLEGAPYRYAAVEV